MTTKPQKQWCYRPPEDARLVGELAASVGMPDLIGALLLQRGIDSPEEARAFLWPTLAQLPAPQLLKGMDRAVQILGDAIREQRPIIIYGDYDVDGVTGVAVLALFLKELGINCRCCQPSRFQQGYGFKAELVEDASKNAIVITVDCGISDAAEVARAKALGLTVIVTDHHQPPAQLPAADAIINPLQPGCEFPFKHLAGVGVAFYLAMGLRAHLVESGYFADPAAAPNLKAYLDLVAIGTICDMTPLVEANRIMTIAGLEVLATSNRPGLRYLFEIVKVSRQCVTAADIGCRVGPRLNAPGRLGAADLSLELLMCDEPVQAKALAEKIDNINRERQEIVRQVAEEATERAAERIEDGANALVLHQKDWHGGILGIVASRLVDDYHRPTILLSSRKDGLIKGSGRSVPGFDLHAALVTCADLLENYGGHTAAVGLALQPERLAEFTARFEQVVATQLDPEALQPLLWVDQVISGEELNHDIFMKGYQRLAPFGMGNPEPVFAVSQAMVLDNAKVVGRDHLKFTARINGSRWGGIGFGLGRYLDQVEGGLALPAFNIRQNFFRGREEWQLSVVDISPPATI
ncbi:single-stranded-DNA-specific exonuclease RecJ [Thermodesulfobacteriota bacterium]